MKTVILCLFGVYDPKLRTPVEMEGYDEYLEGAADIVADLARRSYPTLILAGGVTNRELPETSEAASVKPVMVHLLEKRGVDLRKVTILLEEKSINTPQNVRHSIHMVIHGEREYPRDLLLITDHVRKMKMQAIVWREKKFHFGTKGKFYKKVLGGKVAPLTFEVRTLPRKDIHPNSRWSVQFKQALAYVMSSKIYNGQVMAQRAW